MNEFQEQILENYKNPQNFGKPGWNSHNHAKSENISCGDEVEVFLKIENNIVEDIKFIGRGCSIAIASASLLSQLFKGKPANEIRDYSLEDLKELLGIELTTSRQACALLPLNAFKNALKA